MTLIEFEVATECRTCGQQYFSHESSTDRCMDCEQCFGCEAAALDGEAFCSPDCQSSFKVQRAMETLEQIKRSVLPRPSRDISKAERLRIFERDEWTCHLCGDFLDASAVWPAPGSPVLDHVIPLSRGGPTVAENLKAAHARCNNLRSDRDLGTYMAEVKVSPINL